MVCTWQVHEVLKAVIDPVHLRLVASQRDRVPPAGAPRSARCCCQACSTAAGSGDALSGVTCRVPLPAGPPNPDASAEDQSLPENPEESNAAAESSILPILGSIGSVSKKASIKSLRCPVLKELHGVAPVRSVPGLILPEKFLFSTARKRAACKRVAR